MAAGEMLGRGGGRPGWAVGPGQGGGGEGWRRFLAKAEGKVGSPFLGVPGGEGLLSRCGQGERGRAVAGPGAECRGLEVAVGAWGWVLRC